MSGSDSNPEFGPPPPVPQPSNPPPPAPQPPNSPPPFWNWKIITTAITVVVVGLIVHLAYNFDHSLLIDGALPAPDLELPSSNQVHSTANSVIVDKKLAMFPVGVDKLHGWMEEELKVLQDSFWERMWKQIAKDKPLLFAAMNVSFLPDMRKSLWKVVKEDMPVLREAAHKLVPATISLQRDFRRLIGTARRETIAILFPSWWSVTELLMTPHDQRQQLVHEAQLSQSERIQRDNICTLLIASMVIIENRRSVSEEFYVAYQLARLQHGNSVGQIKEELDRKHRSSLFEDGIAIRKFVPEDRIRSIKSLMDHLNDVVSMQTELRLAYHQDIDRLRYPRRVLELQAQTWGCNLEETGLLSKSWVWEPLKGWEDWQVWATHRWALRDVASRVELVVDMFIGL